MISTGYISIAVLDETENYVAIETISVMKNSCDLSGAWVLVGSEIPKMESILANKLIFNISEKANLDVKDNSTILLNNFLKDAVNEANIALKEFQEYVAEDPKKRKNLIQPTFNEWPESINLENLEKCEADFKIKMIFENSQPEIKRTLAMAKLIQHLVILWQQDEQERNNRRYLNNEQSNFTLLPPSWVRLAV